MRSWRALIVVGVVLLGVAAGGWLLSRNLRSVASGEVQTAQAGDLSVTLRVDDVTVGTREFEITVEDASGRPADVGELRLAFAMTDMDMGSSEIRAEPVGQGRFRARGSYFTMVGTWQVEARVLRDGQPPVQVPFRLAVAASWPFTSTFLPFSLASAALKVE